jgi:PAS domain S-box-containing protein
MPPTPHATPDSPLQVGVLDASPNAIVSVGGDGRIAYANPQVLTTFGWEPADLIGQPIEVLIPDHVQERHIGHRDGFLRQHRARPMGIGLDLAGRRRDGTEFPVEISLAPLEGEDGLMVFATVVDITARKALEGQLLQALKMESIGRMAGGIAHDFNNMLSAIRGYAELLLEDLASPTRPAWSDVQQNVVAIADAAERAATLTAQLLAFSHQQVVSAKVLDVRASILDLEPMLRRLIGEQVDIVFALDPATGPFRGDPGQLDQILVNLVVNARDAVSEGGRVTVETGNVELEEHDLMEHADVAPGPYVLLTVSDTGSGMDDATKARIFDPFFTTKPMGAGTGLGLATTYGIVRQSGGHIRVSSEPGAGSVFRLYFPRVAPGPAEAPAPEAEARAVGSGRVLVVEDDGMVRDLTARVLDRAGYTVLLARNGAEALALIDAGEGSVDVLVSDVVMPGMSGPDLAQEVLRRHPSIGIVFVSGYTAASLNLDEIRARGALFLGKPFNPSDLVRAVGTARGVA